MSMNDCITKVLSYPITYMGKIRQLKKQQILLKNTQFYPAYPILIFVSILCNAMLSGWMMYYFIQSDIHQCYSGVTVGIQILACVYPIYQVVIFLTLIISISTSTKNCWKYFIMLIFTIITTSFGFGGLGVVYTCMIHYEDPNAIPNSFLTQNYFIQIIVYIMLIFILLYILLVPLTSWLQARRNPQAERTDCECCIYVFHFIFQILLFIGAIVFIAIAIGGIPILFYLLNGITQSAGSSQVQFFAFALTSIVAPSGVFLIIFILSKFYACDQQEMKIQQQKQKQLNESNIEADGVTVQTKRKSINLDDQQPQNILQKDTKRQILLQTNQSRMFGEEQFIDKNKRKSKLKESTVR